MDNFAEIERLEELSGNKVDLFSVRFEGEEANLFERFVLRHREDEEIEEEFKDLMAWLERLKRTGAEAHLFRHEQRAEALPPRAKYLDFNYGKNLRLYCMRLSDRALFLFDGGIKTAQRAQDCPNVRQAFKEANELSEAIERMRRDRDLEMDQEDRLRIEESSLTL